jgi:NAD(P)-dependent dehydrogenase (short-subunit alcohol dehydrogenase family)
MQGTIRASGINEVSRLPREQLADPGEPARAIAWLCTDEAVDLAGRELSIGDGELRHRAGLES